MKTKKKESKTFYYHQNYGGKNYSIRNFWCPGDALTEGDYELLKEVKDFYRKNGYSPCRGDIPLDSVCRLKGRFRTWKNVLLAAELPGLNSAETQRKRKDASEKKKEENEYRENDSNV